jgi:hypothetical protein
MNSASLLFKERQKWFVNYSKRAFISSEINALLIYSALLRLKNSLSTYFRARLTPQLRDTWFTI